MSHSLFAELLIHNPGGAEGALRGELYVGDYHLREVERMAKGKPYLTFWS
jgi:hypothetical protein